MGILSRISKVLESNLNAIVERAEDPAKMLEQAIDDMKKGRQEAREAIIEAKTQQRLLARKRDKARLDASAFERKAMNALEMGNEDLARKALELKLGCDTRADAEDSAVAEQEAQIQQLDLAEKELERRLAEMPARRAALMARQSAAQAKGARVAGANKHKNSVSSAMEAFERMEERVIRAEVEAEVVSQGDPNVMLLEAGDMTRVRTDEALAALKSKMTAQLTAGKKKAPEVVDVEVDDDDEPDPVEDSLADLKARLRNKG